MQIIPRSAIGFSPEITGPAFEPQFVEGIVWHWAGGNVNITTEAAVLRNMQTQYVTGRGYSLGYSYCVGPSGSIYEIRGLTFRPASNGDVSTNRRAPSVLILAARMTDDVTDNQLASLRWLTGWLVGQLPNAVQRFGHRDLWATQCPGERWYADIKAGRFEPTGPTPAEDDTMAKVVRREGGALALFAMSGVDAVHIANESDYRTLADAGIIPDVPVHVAAAEAQVIGSETLKKMVTRGLRDFTREELL